LGGGTPYRWIQTLSGIYYTHPRVQRLPHMSVAAVMSRIRQRFRTRSSLLKQLQACNKKTLPFATVTPEFPIRTKVFHSFFKHLCCSLTQLCPMCIHSRHSIIGNQ
jgi:hypothetical protein